MHFRLTSSAKCGNITLAEGGLQMNNAVIRLDGISIHNFKNVMDGSIELSGKKRGMKASILGLYGQNGSGKTALIDAIQLLQYALQGKSIPAQFADCIHVDAAYSSLSFSFVVNNRYGTYHAIYSFSLRKEKDETAQNSTADVETASYRTCLFDEELKCSFESEKEKVRLTPLMDTKTDDIFIPRSKYKLLVGAGKTVATDLLVAKRITAATSRSFLFSRELLSVIRTNQQKADQPEEALWYMELISNLVAFGNHELFIINTANSGLISLNAQPLAFKYEEKNMGAFGTIAVSLEGPSVVPVEATAVVRKVIDSMNIVLQQIVPGLTIQVMSLGTQLMDNGKPGERIQLLSLKNKKAIPLKYESEGIKKIISILQLLIVVYNQPSMTVAVDELDSGVFEYLLGEILRIISEKGKGQLIFTSHNLRPLETLDKSFIAFTTTNPENRYLRMTNVKENNNLRDLYYRGIMLGEQSEELYEPTNNAEIALAFHEAGEVSGS